MKIVIKVLMSSKLEREYLKKIDGKQVCHKIRF